MLGAVALGAHWGSGRGPRLRIKYNAFFGGGIHVAPIISRSSMRGEKIRHRNPHWLTLKNFRMSPPPKAASDNNLSVGRIRVKATGAVAAPVAMTILNHSRLPIRKH